MVLSTGLQAFFNFDSDSVNDVSGNSRNWTNDGTTDNASGKINDCRNFDGSNDRLTRTGTFGIESAGAFSFEDWLYIDNVGSSGGNTDHYLFEKGSANILIWADNTTTGLDNNRFVFLFNGTRIQSTTSYVVNTWYHIICTYDGSNMRLFIDGVYEAIAANTGSTDATDTYVSGQRSTIWMDGRQDIMGIWNRSLTYGSVSLSSTAGGEVAEKYNSGTGLQYPFVSGWTGIINGVTNPAKVNGILVALIAKINGVQ